MHREKAIRTVVDFVQGQALDPITQHLFLVDVILSGASRSASDTGKGKSQVCANVCYLRAASHFCHFRQRQHGLEPLLEGVLVGREQHCNGKKQAVAVKRALQRTQHHINICLKE